MGLGVGVGGWGVWLGVGVGGSEVVSEMRMHVPPPPNATPKLSTVSIARRLLL